MKVIFEDDYLIVCEKPVGVDAQSSRSFVPDMVSLLKNYLQQGKKEPYVGVIHRLDKPVGGLLVYGKTPESSAALCELVREHRVVKQYFGVICGKLVDKQGVFVDYLLRDGKLNTSKVVSEKIGGAKRAELSYEVLETIGDEVEVLSLVRVELKTGRHHQIRVQFSDRGFPLWADNRYHPRLVKERSRESVALYACALEFVHPMTGESMTFRSVPGALAFRKFDFFGE